MNLSSRSKLTKVSDLTADGTSAINSGSVDMQGFEGALFFTSLGTAASDNTMEAAQSANDSSFNDLLGSQVTSGSSDEDMWLDIYKPLDRYVRVELARGTTTTVGDIWCLQYGAHKMAISNVTSGTIIGEIHASPAEGTA